MESIVCHLRLARTAASEGEGAINLTSCSSHSNEGEVRSWSWGRTSIILGYSSSNGMLYDTITSAIIVKRVSTEIPSSITFSTYWLTIKRSNIIGFNFCSALKVFISFFDFLVYSVIRWWFFVLTHSPGNFNWPRWSLPRLRCTKPSEAHCTWRATRCSRREYDAAIYSE